MKKIALPLIVAAMGLATTAAHAAQPNGGVLTINGALTAQTCDVSGNGAGNNFSVTLPTLSAAELNAAGSTGGSTGFNIAQTNCAQAGKVRTFWEYGTNTLSDGNLKNAATGATVATNVEVQLLDYNTGSPLTIDVSKADGAQNSQLVAITSGAATLQYAAQYISPTGKAGPCSVMTSVTYSMSYQ